MAAAHHLREVTRKEVAGRAKLGVAAFAEALLGVPKTLAENSGYDAQVAPAPSCVYKIIMKAEMHPAPQSHLRCTNIHAQQ